MDLKDEKVLTIINENGEEELFEIIFTFDSEETSRSYVVYQPIEVSEGEEETDTVFPKGNLGALDRR